MVIINIYLFTVLLWCLQMLTLVIVIPAMRENITTKTLQVIHKIKSSEQDSGVEYLSPEQEYEKDLYE